MIQIVQKSYNNLPYDEYIPDKTRQRRYANYLVKNIKDNKNNINKFSIQHTEKTTFEQDVEDSRKDERIFQLIENPYHPFLLNFITLASELTYMNHYPPIQNLSIDVHQVRQLCYPNLNSHNSAEGIHQDGANYIISACVLNRYNIQGGTSSVYDNNLDNGCFADIDEQIDELLKETEQINYYVGGDFLVVLKLNRLVAQNNRDAISTLISKYEENLTQSVKYGIFDKWR